MRILVHDYAGHPFQVQLSRLLAGRGHQVLHAYSASISGPKGALESRPGDPSSLELRGLRIRQPLDRYSFVKRRFQEVEYGRHLAEVIGNWRPELILSGNTPVEAQARAFRCGRRQGARCIHWLQDFYGLATHRLLRKRLPVIGEIAGRYYRRLETGIVRRADAVVVITEDFVPLLIEQGVEAGRISVIHNWAPLDEITVEAKDNDWARRHALAASFCFLYAGTLGMKHNPELLLGLAEHFRDRSGVRVVVVSEGAGADFLTEESRSRHLSNLIVLPYQPFGMLSRVLAAGDVLVTILEPEAGVFSVPSKVLTYHCVGRPLLLAVPPDNLAVRLVSDAGSGLVAPPDRPGEFISQAERLFTDPELRQRQGQRARAWAQQQFDIEAIGDRFEILFEQSAGSPIQPEDALT